MYFSDKQYIAPPPPPPPPDCQVFLMFFTYFSKTRPEKEGKRYLNVYEISPQQRKTCLFLPLLKKTAGRQNPSAGSCASIISRFAGNVKYF